MLLLVHEDIIVRLQSKMMTAVCFGSFFTKHSSSYREKTCHVSVLYGLSIHFRLLISVNLKLISGHFCNMFNNNL